MEIDTLDGVSWYSSAPLWEVTNTGDNQEKWTPLLCACVFGGIEIVQYLIENGANVNVILPVSLKLAISQELTNIWDSIGWMDSIASCSFEGSFCCCKMPDCKWCNRQCFSRGRSSYRFGYLTEITNACLVEPSDSTSFCLWIGLFWHRGTFSGKWCWRECKRQGEILLFSFEYDRDVSLIHMEYMNSPNKLHSTSRLNISTLTSWNIWWKTVRMFVNLMVWASSSLTLLRKLANALNRVGKLLFIMRFNWEAGV